MAAARGGSTDAADRRRHAGLDLLVEGRVLRLRLLRAFLALLLFPRVHRARQVRELFRHPSQKTGYAADLEWTRPIDRSPLKSCHGNPNHQSFG